MNESDEEAVISETGGIKGQKIARFDLIPPGPLRALAEHFGRGARKYAPRNWEKGYQWSLSYAALQRHLNAFWGGEDWDEETGSHHLDAAMFHVMALREFVAKERYQGFDDRPDGHTSNAEAVRRVTERLERQSPVPRKATETGGIIFEDNAVSEQAKERRDGPVQASRWVIP